MERTLEQVRAEYAQNATQLGHRISHLERMPQEIVDYKAKMADLAKEEMTLLAKIPAPAVVPAQPEKSA